MIYTVIYKNESDLMGTFTFVSQRHDKNSAWAEFIKDYAKPGQSPMAIMPGHQIVYFPQDISFTAAAK